MRGLGCFGKALVFAFILALPFGIGKGLVFLAEKFLSSLGDLQNVLINVGIWLSQDLYTGVWQWVKGILPKSSAEAAGVLAGVSTTANPWVQALSTLLSWIYQNLVIVIVIVLIIGFIFFRERTTGAIQRLVGTKTGIIILAGAAIFYLFTRDLEMNAQTLVPWAVAAAIVVFLTLYAWTPVKGILVQFAESAFVLIGVLLLIAAGLGAVNGFLGGKLSSLTALLKQVPYAGGTLNTAMMVGTDFGSKSGLTNTNYVLVGILAVAAVLYLINKRREEGG